MKTKTKALGAGTANLSVNMPKTLGGDHPEDLLQKPFSEYARTLSGK